jgi:glutamate-ammonia-ligase adenylyltransferase
MGKLGGRELSFGSDLDLVFVSGARDSDQNPARIRRLRQILSATTARDAVFDLDLRLRPHGEAGAFAPGIDVFRNYFRKSAQPWERQVLTRARPISGPPELAEQWQRFIDETVYERPLAVKEADELWSMRLRVQRERDPVQPPERAFKTGAGGLIDVEFALQILQMKHGAQHPAVRTANTGQGWRELAAAGLVETGVAMLIQKNHQHLKRIEWCLRRDINRSVTVLPSAPEEQKALARWLGTADWATFWSEHRDRMIQTRNAVSAALSEVVSSTTLECGR